MRGNPSLARQAGRHHASAKQSKRAASVSFPYLTSLFASLTLPRSGGDALGVNNQRHTARMHQSNPYASPPSSPPTTAPTMRPAIQSIANKVIKGLPRRRVEKRVSDLIL